MKTKSCIIGFGICIVFFACNEQKKPDKTNKEIIESVISNIKEDQIENVVINKDTLKFVSSGWFYYYPFGKFNNIESFKNANKDFAITLERDQGTSELDTVYRARYKRSFVKLFYQPDTERIEIVSGKILDPSIKFTNGTFIGIGKKEFLKLIFKKNIEMNSINTIKIFSVLEGINHTYNFKSDQLATISFDTDYLLSKD